MKIRELTRFLETIAPAQLQEEYDNSGLIIGDADTEITGAIICLDSIEAVIDEAIAHKCNLVIAHHPLIFRGIKKLNSSSYIGRTILKAIQNNINIYAIHTNLDNVLYQGVNTKIAETLGLQNTTILSKKRNLSKVEILVDKNDRDRIIEMIEAFNHTGGISFHINEEAKPPGMFKVNFSCESNLANKISSSLEEEQSVFSSLVVKTENENNVQGSGIVGDLEKPMKTVDFLKLVKDKMQAGCVRHTAITKKEISKVAICGGSGSFLLPNAIAAGADIYITADFKYHEFFDANNEIIIADIGHYESEQYTIQLLFEIIKNKYSNFAVRLTKVNTNPLNYL